MVQFDFVESQFAANVWCCLSGANMLKIITFTFISILQKATYMCFDYCSLFTSICMHSQPLSHVLCSLWHFACAGRHLRWSLRLRALKLRTFYTQNKQIDTIFRPVYHCQFESHCPGDCVVRWVIDWSVDGLFHYFQHVHRLFFISTISKCARKQIFILFAECEYARRCVWLSQTTFLDIWDCVTRKTVISWRSHLAELLGPNIADTPAQRRVVLCGILKVRSEFSIISWRVLLN